ncbi:5'-nucleotidase [Thalassobaculum sp.]|uniref:5'-nucleotidase n=1 Tax=Thalassobaculum sp. TaxID=2022740 RepID=UPI003B592FB8
MAYPIEDKLVVAVSSTALFDLTKEHELFLSKGLEAFRVHQRENKNNPCSPGVAFPFVERILHLNKIFDETKPVEVVILSRNHPDAGMRVLESVQYYGLEISRCAFTSGVPPYEYMKSFNSVLYLSTDSQEVKTAVDMGYPAGHVLPCQTVYDPGKDTEEGLTIAFDFDGIIVDDEAEKHYAEAGLDLFHHMEKRHRERPLNSGPLLPLIKKISDLQKIEKAEKENRNSNDKYVKVAILTARNMPAHERILTTLNNYGIDVDQLLLTGGIQKKRFLDVLKPHIFFDDQIQHLEDAAAETPCVHVPFGVRNQTNR